MARPPAAPSRSRFPAHSASPGTSRSPLAPTPVRPRSGSCTTRPRARRFRPPRSSAPSPASPDPQAERRTVRWSGVDWEHSRASRPVTSWHRVGTATVQIAAPLAVADPIAGALVDLAVDPPQDAGGVEEPGHPRGEPALRDSTPTPDIEITVVAIGSGYRVEHARSATDTPGDHRHRRRDRRAQPRHAPRVTTPRAHACRGSRHRGRRDPAHRSVGGREKTLTAALVDAGLSYLSDERVGIDSTGMAHPYHKPLSLKRGSWPLIPQLKPSDADDDRRIWQIPASRISPETDRPEALAGPTRPRLILRLRHHRTRCLVSSRSAAAPRSSP